MKWKVTCGGEVNEFDTQREAIDWARFQEQSPTACNATVERIGLPAIEDYKIVDHGIDGEQYFQGAGTAYTQWNDCYTGIGDSPAQALGDALEQLATEGKYDAESLPVGWDDGVLKLTDDKITILLESQCECSECKSEDGESINCTHDCDCFAESQLHCYVTLYVK